jgi:hypothetical protein
MFNNLTDHEERRESRLRRSCTRTPLGEGEAREGGGRNRVKQHAREKLTLASASICCSIRTFNDRTFITHQGDGSASGERFRDGAARATTGRR